MVKTLIVGELDIPGERVADAEEAAKRALEAVESGEKVLIVARGAWRMYNRIASDARMSGLNYYLLEALDPLEAELAGKPLSSLAMARISYLARRPAEKAVSEVSRGEKRVTRRALLRSAIVGAALEYTEKPIEDQLCSKPSLQRYCEWCKSVCGIEGGCAASAAYCGVELLRVPGYSREGLHDVLRFVASSGEGGLLVFAPRSAMATVVEKLYAAKPGSPVLFIPVSCPYVVGVEELLAARALGYRPIVVEDGWEMEVRRCRESREAYVRGVVADYEKLTSQRLLHRADELAESINAVLEAPPRVGEAGKLISRGLRPAALAEAKRLGSTVELRTGFAGLIVVDQQKCTLCGACAYECPSLALKIVESGEGSALLFMHDRCIACGYCEEVCPEKALAVRRALDSRLVGSWAPLYSEEIVRCIVCGKPIGSRKMVEKVVEKLILAGFKPENMPTILMCPTCKQKYSLGMIDGSRINWDYLRSFVERVRQRLGS